MTSVLRVFSFLFFVFLFWAWVIDAKAADPHCDELAVLDWRGQESYLISTVVNADLLMGSITPYCLNVKASAQIDHLLHRCSAGETYAEAIKSTVVRLDIVCYDFLKEFNALELPYSEIPRP